MVVILAVAVTALVRWFAGDPDGPVLMFYGLFPATCGAVTIALMRWRGGRLLFALAVAVTSVANQCAMFIGMGGFQLIGGTTWALISMVIAAFGGLLWGVVAWHLGRGLENAGVPVVLHREEGALHGFLGSPDRARRIQRMAARAIRAALHRQP